MPKQPEILLSDTKSKFCWDYCFTHQKYHKNTQGSCFFFFLNVTFIKEMKEMWKLKQSSVRYLSTVCEFALSVHWLHYITYSVISFVLRDLMPPQSRCSFFHWLLHSEKKSRILLPLKQEAVSSSRSQAHFSTSHGSSFLHPWSLWLLSSTRHPLVFFLINKMVLNKLLCNICPHCSNSCFYMDLSLKVLSLSQAGVALRLSETSSFWISLQTQRVQLWAHLLQAQFCHLTFPRHVLSFPSLKDSQSSLPLWGNQLPLLVTSWQRLAMATSQSVQDDVQGLFQLPHSMRALIPVAYSLLPIPQPRPLLWLILKDAFTGLRGLVRSQRPLSMLTSVILILCVEQTCWVPWSRSLSWTTHRHVCPEIPCCFNLKKKRSVYFYSCTRNTWVFFCEILKHRKVNWCAHFSSPFLN